jgi:hypothetical protein
LLPISLVIARRQCRELSAGAYRPYRVSRRGGENEVWQLCVKPEFLPATWAYAVTDLASELPSSLETRLTKKPRAELRKSDVYFYRIRFQNLGVHELGLAISKIGPLTPRISSECIQRRPGVLMGISRFSHRARRQGAHRPHPLNSRHGSFQPAGDLYRPLPRSPAAEQFATRRSYARPYPESIGKLCSKGYLMNRLANALERFNRKERNLLIRSGCEVEAIWNLQPTRLAVISSTGGCNLE